MSTTEPTWPTEDEALAQWRRKRDYYTDNNAGMVRCAIDMCRAAWLAANDDPSKSPIGEVRQSPSGVRVVARGDDSLLWRWIAIDHLTPNFRSAQTDTDVTGWRVIGNIPEAQQ